MPLTECVSFKTVIQKNRRIQIPVLIRWRFKLEPGEIFNVVLELGYHHEDFYARMSKDGRLTIPKVIAKEFLKKPKEESLNGYTANVTLYPIVKKDE